MEKLCQSIELSRFQDKECRVRVTVSCSVTKAKPSDTTEQLLARAMHALTKQNE